MHMSVLLESSQTDVWERAPKFQSFSYVRGATNLHILALSTSAKTSIGARLPKFRSG